RLHAAGFQTSATPVAVLGNSVNVAGIDRIGAGIYLIATETALNPNNGIMLATVVAAVLLLIIDPIATDLIHRIEIISPFGAPTDAAFRFAIFRYATP
ncbi:hypothetical protein LCGC14_3143540, partial [marine sediment metagenome]